MDIGQATKLIKLYKYLYSNSPPSSKDYYHTKAEDVRSKLGDMSFMKDFADTSWKPQNETWDDVMNTEYASDLGSLGIGYSQGAATQLAGQMISTSQQNAVNAGYTPEQAQQTTNLIGSNPIYSNQDVTKAQPSGVNAPIIQSGDATQPSGQYDPVADANARFAQYQQSMAGAMNNELDAQMAQANYIINNGGIWKTLQPIAQQQMQDALATLEKTAAIAKANLEASRAQMQAEEAANYDEVIKTINQNLIASRQRTVEEMNQRGLFFSTVLDSVLGQVEAASASKRGQAAIQHSLTLAKIAAQMAALSGNIDIEVIKGNAAAVAQYTATMLQVVAQDEQTKQTAAALVEKLNVQKSGVLDAVAAQTFSTGEQMRTQAINEQYTTEDRAYQSTEREKKDFVDSIAQYSNDYQAAINNLDPNDPLYDFKKANLTLARENKLDDTLKDFASTATQYANDYQAAINALNPSDPLYAQKKAILTALRLDKIAEMAKSNAAAAQQEIENMYKMGQLSVAQYNAETSRIRAINSSSGSSSGGTSGGTTVPKMTFTNANSIKSDYEETQKVISGYVWNPDTNVYEKQTVDMYGAPTVKTMTKDEYEMYANKLKSEKPNYDAAINFISQVAGTQLTGDDAINADTIIQEVIGAQRKHYGINNKDAVDLVLTSKDSTGKTILQFILEQPNGQNILRAIERYFNVDILGG